MGRKEGDTGVERCPSAHLEHLHEFCPHNSVFVANNGLLSGLRWEDLIISETPVVQEALQLAHPDVVKGRMRRLKRASDLSFKGKFYTDYKDPASLEPYKMELFPIIQKIKKRNEEEILLNLHKK